MVCCCWLLDGMVSVRVGGIYDVGGSSRWMCLDRRWAVFALALDGARRRLSNGVEMCQCSCQVFGGVIHKGRECVKFGQKRATGGEMCRLGKTSLGPSVVVCDSDKWMRERLSDVWSRDRKGTLQACFVSTKC